MIKNSKAVLDNIEAKVPEYINYANVKSGEAQKRLKGVINALETFSTSGLNVIKGK